MGRQWADVDHEITKLHPCGFVGMGSDLSSE